MKNTFEQLVEIRNEVALHYGQIKEEDVNSKKEYAIKKWAKVIGKALEKASTKYAEEYQDKKEDLEIEYAHIKEDIIVRGAKGELQYTKEGQKQLTKELKALAKSINERCLAEEIEYEPYLIDLEILGETDPEIIEKLKGVFIK